MRRLISYFLLAGLLLGVCVDARAIAVENLAKSETSPTGEGYSFNWDYIYKYNGSSSMAVDHYWILTAGHVAVSSGSITNDGIVYTQQESVKHSKASDPDGNLTADLALIRFDKPFPGYYLLHNAIPQNTEILVVGYGFPGNVVMNTFNGYFTENRSGQRVRRWGTNKIDETATVNDSKGFDFSISGTFGNGKTTYESGCNDKDSGSGVFYNDGGVWKVMGTVANRYSDGSNFTGNFAVATKYYVNWIKSVITDYDTDMDGLPDWWESDYGTGPTSMDPVADLDNDNFSNYTEWIADTNPTNAASHFKILEWLAPTNVTFSSSADRKYQIESRADLVDTNEIWQTELDWFEGLAGQTEINVTEAASNRFYRIRAKLNY